MSDQPIRVEKEADLVGKTIAGAYIHSEATVMRFTDGSVAKWTRETSEFDGDLYVCWNEDLTAYDLYFIGLIDHAEHLRRERVRALLNCEKRRSEAAERVARLDRWLACAQRHYEKQRCEAAETVARLDRWLAEQPDYPIEAAEKRNP
jgi:hypothetical protein